MMMKLLLLTTAAWFLTTSAQALPPKLDEADVSSSSGVPLSVVPDPSLQAEIERLKKRLDEGWKEARKVFEPWKSFVLETPTFDRVQLAHKLIEDETVEKLFENNLWYKLSTSFIDKELSLNLAANARDIFIFPCHQNLILRKLYRPKRPTSELGIPLINALEPFRKWRSMDGMFLAAFDSTRPLAEMGEPLLAALRPLFVSLEREMPPFFRDVSNESCEIAIIEECIRHTRPISELNPLRKAIDSLFFLEYQHKHRQLPMSSYSKVLREALRSERPLSEMDKHWTDAIKSLCLHHVDETFYFDQNEQLLILKAALHSKCPSSEMGADWIRTASKLECFFWGADWKLRLNVRAAAILLPSKPLIEMFNRFKNSTDLREVGMLEDIKKTLHEFVPESAVESLIPDWNQIETM